MTFLRGRLLNATVVTLISLFYGAIFMIISGHMEFISIIPEKDANMGFMEPWRQFLLSNNLKYLGATMICMGLVILARTIYVVIKHDKIELSEHETALLQKGLCITGIMTIILLPLLFLLILSQPNFSVPYTTLFIVVTWGTFSFASLYFVFKH
jgi:hypothetical protein